MSSEKHIPSGFPTIDAHEGGFLKGGLFLVRPFGACYEEQVQDYIVAQVKQFAVDAGLGVLVCSVQMNEKNFVKCLCINETVSGIRKLSSSSVYITVPDAGETYKEIVEKLEGFSKEVEPDIIIIDGIDSVLPMPVPNGEIDTSVSDALLSLAASTGLPVIVSDYDGLVEIGLHRKDAVTEMEVKTDIRDTVQAAVYSNDKKTIIEDLYSFWTIFDGFNKKPTE